MSIMRNIRRFLVAFTAVPFIVAMVLAGCAKAPQPAEFDGGGGSITVGVAAVDILDDDGQSNRLVVGGVSRWAHQVFSPGAARGNLLVTITEARLSTTELPGQSGLKAFFTNEVRAKIRADIKLFLSFTHPENGQTASLNLNSHAEAGIPDNATPAESDAIRDEAIADAIRLIDGELRGRLPGISRKNNWPQIK